MQTTEYSYQMLKDIFSVYGRLLKYRVDACVVKRMVEFVCERLPKDMRCKIEYAISQDYEVAIKELQLAFEDTNDLRYLCSDENVVLKIWYVLDLYYYASRVYCFFLIVVVLKKEDLYSCVYLFQPKWLKKLKMTEDIQIFLFWIKEQLYKEVEVIVNDQRLIEYYPFLHKEQVSFYLEHREIYCFYTIQQYMKYNNVCYETSRMHLEQLVCLGWYVKKKVGKKFVYSRSVEYGV